MCEPSPLDAVCRVILATLDQRGRVRVPGVGTFTARRRASGGRGATSFRTDPQLQRAVDAGEWSGGQPQPGLTVPGVDGVALGALLDELIRALVEPAGAAVLPGLGTLSVRRTPHRRVESGGGVVCIPGQNHVRFTPLTAG